MKPQANLEAAAWMLTLCFGVLATPAIDAAEADPAATLAAIHLLENPRDLPRSGPRGELGAYQFRATTWRAYTDEPFVRALDRRLSDEIAQRHFAWLKRRLEAAHVAPTTYNIALAWNGGLRAAISGRAPRAAHGYAQRAENLATEFVRDANRPVLVADGAR